MKTTLHAACLQLCSSDNIEENFHTIEQLLAPYPKLELILLPENTTLITANNSAKHDAAQPQSVDHIYAFFSTLAKQHQAWLIAGTILIQDKNNPDKSYNHCPVFSPTGALVCHYNKIHLFDADLGSESWQESQSISAGDAPQSIPLDTPWKAGLSVCYDLRFPELYRHYSAQDCNILTVPAAFTVPTGKAHWKCLLKARAIENQCYVLAAGQWGKHQDGRTTYGHSMIIDPWGKVLAKLEEGEGIITAQLNYKHLQHIRQQLPILQHRKLP